MRAPLVYMELELKRACKRLPHIIAGAIVLLVLMGTVALLANRMLYGKQVVGRIAVGVVLPEEDALAKQVVSMVSSLESVKSICDFSYLEQEEAHRRLKEGSLYAVMEVPEGFVQDIMNGTNTPVAVILPKGAGIESRIFKELTDAGARTLGASQAGIYAGDQLLMLYGLSESVSQLEADLNRIYMQYSLPRMDYFKKVKVSATGDVDPLTFYGISAVVLMLLLSAVPVSGYLTPLRPVVKQKLALSGISSGTVVCSRILGMSMLYLVLGLLFGMGAGWKGWIEIDLLFFCGMLLVCIAAASVTVCIFHMAGSLMAGVMLLFLAVTAMHFGAGGFLPLIFLPEGIQRLAPFLPNYSLMAGLKAMVTSQWTWETAAGLLLVSAAGFGISMAAEVRRR